MNTTWRKLISEDMKYYGESFDDVVALTMPVKYLDEEFDSYRSCTWWNFTVYTSKRAYFPKRSGTFHECWSVLRNPTEEMELLWRGHEK